MSLAIPSLHSVSAAAKRVLHSSVLSLMPGKFTPPFPIRMPENVQGKVTLWMKRVGDAVRAGEPLCEIETKVSPWGLRRARCRDFTRTSAVLQSNQ
jgi:hypothetical protein